MREQPIRRGTVPMLHVRWDQHGIAGVQRLRLLALEAYAPDAGQAVQRLPDRMRVPGGASAGVNDTTEARMRDGVVPTTTSSWNTVPLNVLAAPCFVGGPRRE